MDDKTKNVNKTIDASLSDMLSDIGEIIAVPAMAPSFEGGEGELERSQVIGKILKKSNVFDSIKHYDVIQSTETGDIVRPNLVAMVNGVDSTLPTTWIITHMDEVPTGNLKLWYSNPRKLTLAIEEDFGFQTVSIDDLDKYIGTSEFDKLVVIGRSVDDDVKPGVGAVYALKALKAKGIVPNGNIGLVFVSDEETGGSEYGIRHLAEKIRLFKPEDLIIVPDDGNETGDVIEIAEKSRLVIKVTTEGKQGHSANGYDDSKNASEVASRYQIEFVDWFREKYKARNKLFEPSYSTIQPTQRHIESGSANTVPGVDISFIDMRLLPKYNIDDVLDYAKNLADKYQDQSEIKMIIENPVHTLAPPETSSKCEVVTKLIDAIQAVRGVKPKMIGIGGETCANHLRKIKIQGKYLNVAVYCSITGTEHKINERAKLAHILYDTKVFAHMFMN
ncbi:MAG: M20/M25/M40 family metallo-hydrolase [Candidatus Aenigmarchaeota archaeon]|nr:M20/M25/M40 family metallo-hydrolase [Candidatus Aenigmarchaeota archaeon]